MLGAVAGKHEASWGPAVLADDPCLAACRAAGPEYADQYYRARYYDPRLGRFVTEDPSGFRADINFYRYVYDNPVNFVDPYGLDTQECFRDMQGPDWLVGKDPADKIKHPVVTSTNTGMGYGFGPAPGWSGLTPVTRVPGHIVIEYPYDKYGKPKPEYSCSTVSKDECVEECVIREAEAQSKNPPAYNVGTYQCNNWAADIVKKCKAACGGK